MHQFVISGLKSDVNVELKLESVTTFHLSHKIYYKIIVKML